MNLFVAAKPGYKADWIEVIRELNSCCVQIGSYYPLFGSYVHKLGLLLYEIK